jgi:chorismate mutase
LNPERETNGLAFFVSTWNNTGGGKMPVRGVRGATVAAEDSAEAILAAARELLAEILRVNPDLRSEEIASALFTVTDDLNAAYPAAAAREMGWAGVPLMCAREIPVPESLTRCIRIMLLWNTELPQSAIRHVYLREAAGLRPDLQIGLQGES